MRFLPPTGLISFLQGRLNTMTWIKKHRTVLALCAIAALLALIPVFNIWRGIGAQWQGVIPGYGDEGLYYNQIHEIAEGNFWYGNQYLMEHSDGPPSVIFAGHWLAAIPLWIGFPFVPAMYFNNVLWSIIFVLLGYWLLRELSLPKILSAAGSLFSYLTCYGLVLRPSSRQEVYPFFLLFFIALIRFLKKPEEWSSIIFLGLAAGATFYVFSYLWQTVVITLGLLALYALYMRAWSLLRSTLLASAIGGVLGLPPLLYMFYLSKTYPYFLESIARFGLVDTHLPMAEVVYSGGWIGLMLLVVGFVLWRLPSLREADAFGVLVVFVAVSGLGLWIMQGSNLITGKLLETGEHIRPFIGPWLALAGAPVLWVLWRNRLELTVWSKTAVVVGVLALGYATSVFVGQYFYHYVDAGRFAESWREAQGYAAPLRWIDAQQDEPVVVWSQNDGVNSYLPMLSRDYVLYSPGALFTLVPNTELQERYLVTNYFNNPSVDYLKAHLAEYVGREDAYHHAKTIERGIKICRIIFYFDKARSCGVPPTSIGLMGEQFFAGLEKKFTDDIRPHIKTYLQKYHVSYIITDTNMNPTWTPQSLGARKVCGDGRYEIYR